MDARHHGMTPLCDTLRDDVAKECLRLFGFKANAPAKARVDNPDDEDISWRVLLDIFVSAEETLTFEIFPIEKPENKEDLWAEIGGFGARYRRLADGRDPRRVRKLAPFMDQLHRNLTQAKEKGSFVRFRKAAQSYAPFVGIDDFALRQITLGLEGWTGTLRLGFRCNQDCGFCWQGRSWPDPPEEYPLIWLDEFHERGVDSLNISGGEPTLYKTLPDIILKAREYGMSVQLETNAIRFGRPSYTTKMVEAGLDGALISYHSADAATSDQMTKAPSTHSATERGIIALLEARRPEAPHHLHISLNCVIEKANHNQLVEHAERIVECFVKPSPENPIKEVVYTFPTLYFDMDTWQEAMVALDEIQPHLSKAAKILVDAGVSVQCLGTCGFPPCLLKEVPEVLWSYPLEDAQPMDKNARAYAEICEDCGMKSGCLGIRHEYFRLFGERGLSPFPPDVNPTREQDMRIEKMQHTR